jgi:hypothetical protein
MLDGVLSWAILAEQSVRLLESWPALSQAATYFGRRRHDHEAPVGIDENEFGGPTEFLGQSGNQVKARVPPGHWADLDFD